MEKETGFLTELLWQTILCVYIWLLIHQENTNTGRGNSVIDSDSIQRRKSPDKAILSYSCHHFPINLSHFFLTVLIHGDNIDNIRSYLTCRENAYFLPKSVLHMWLLSIWNVTGSNSTCCKCKVHIGFQTEN